MKRGAPRGAVYSRKNRAKAAVKKGQAMCGANLQLSPASSPTKAGPLQKVLDDGEDEEDAVVEEQPPRKAPTEEVAPAPFSPARSASSSSHLPPVSSFPTTPPPSPSSFARHAEESAIDRQLARSRRAREESHRARESALAVSPQSRRFKLGGSLLASTTRYRATLVDSDLGYRRWRTNRHADLYGDHHYDLDGHLAKLDELSRAGKQSSSLGLDLINRTYESSSSSTRPSSASRVLVSYQREGLQNLGNTCYMNAVLQSLLSLETFVSDMNKERFIQQLPYTSFYQALLQIAVEMRREKHGIINPWPVKEAVARMAKQFSDWTQQDAHEFLVSSVDQLEGEIGKFAREEEKKPSIQERDEECPVFLNFESEVEHTFTCRNPDCENMLRKSEIFRDFSLELPETTSSARSKLSVQDLVKYWFQGDEVVEMRCDKCGEAGEADVGHTFLRLPRVLILQLKRFKSLSSDIFTINKITDAVSINKTLDLGFCCDRRTHNPPAPTPLNLPSHDSAFVLPFSSSSATSTTSSSNSSVRSSEFKIPSSPSTKVLVPPSSSLPSKNNEFEDISSALNGGLAKRQRTVEPKPSSDRLPSVEQIDDDDMIRALKASEQSYAEDHHDQLEERLRREQEELDMAIALSLQDDDRPRSSNEAKRKRETEEERPSTEASGSPERSTPRKMSRIFDDDYDPKQEEWPEPQDKCDPQYRLRSIVVHWGAKASMGHYTSYVYNPKSDQWKEYNDDKVFSLKDSTALGEQAEKNSYLLFYVHTSVQSHVKESAGGPAPPVDSVDLSTTDDTEDDAVVVIDGEKKKQKKHAEAHTATTRPDEVAVGNSLIETDNDILEDILDVTPAPSRPAERSSSPNREVNTNKKKAGNTSLAQDMCTNKPINLLTNYEPLAELHDLVSADTADMDEDEALEKAIALSLEEQRSNTNL